MTGCPGWKNHQKCKHYKPCKGEIDDIEKLIGGKTCQFAYPGGCPYENR